MSAATIKARAKRGAAKLDEYQKNWPTKVDLESFNIDSNHSCILGQVFKGDCYGGLSKLGLKESQIIANGFQNDENDTGDGALQAAWVEEIQSRLPKKKAAKAVPAEEEPKPKAKKSVKKVTAKATKKK